MDMVERAGRAVEKILWPHDSTPYASGGKAEAIARAVIEAMREPTDAMLEDAGIMEGFDADAWAREADRCHREWWSTMIDAALGPQMNLDE